MSLSRKLWIAAMALCWLAVVVGGVVLAWSCDWRLGIAVGIVCAWWVGTSIADVLHKNREGQS
jgi:hypothetical protein